jgi:hypothetical protein
MSKGDEEPANGPPEETAASEDSGEDNESLGLMSKEDGQKKPRKYDMNKFSSNSGFLCCCPSRRACLSVLVGAIVMLLVVVITLVAVIVALVVTNSKQSGEETDMITSEGLEGDTGLGGEGPPWKGIRLPSFVVPETYDIDLTVDMDHFQVTGLVSILCDVKDRVDYVALHAVGMTISKHVLKDEIGEIVEHTGVVYPENNFFIFNLTTPLDPGLIVATLHFNYTLGDDLAGFYRSSYRDASGKSQYLAVSQLEPMGARKAFPCFDEPSFKASFTVSVTHQSHYKAWSNMPAQVSTDYPSSGGSLVTTHFMTSLKMSTYLVAFVVSDFKCIEDKMTSISGKEIVVSDIDAHVFLYLEGSWDKRDQS